MKNILKVLLLTLSLSSVSLADTYLSLGNKTFHDKCCYNDKGVKKPYNEENLFIGIDNGRWIVAAFENSYYDPAVMVGRILPIFHTKYVSTHAILLGVYGYDNLGVDFMGISPMVLFGANIDTPIDRLKISVHTIGKSMTTVGVRIRL